jgi:hypothetical protein
VPVPALFSRRVRQVSPALMMTCELAILDVRVGTRAEQRTDILMEVNEAFEI